MCAVSYFFLGKGVGLGFLLSLRRSLYTDPLFSGGRRINFTVFLRVLARCRISVIFALESRGPIHM